MGESEQAGSDELRRNVNPIIELLENKLPARCVEIITLRRAGAPVVVNLQLPGKSRFVRREDFEPAEGDVVARSAEITRSEVHMIDEPWRDLEELEGWIEEAGWWAGAWDMVRFSKPREADPEHWREQPGNGIGVAFCGLDNVYAIPGSTGMGADNWELGDIAAREGWWSWCFKPNRGWARETIEFKVALRGDLRLRPDGGRDLPFPGWLESPRFAGRSGAWWLGLAKSFEVSDEPGHALRIVWNFSKRMLALRS